MQSTGGSYITNRSGGFESRVNKSIGPSYENENWLEDQDSDFDMSMNGLNSEYWPGRPAQNDTMNRVNDQIEDLNEDSLGKNNPNF